MNQQIHENTPVLIGSGQIVVRDVDSPAQVKSAVELASEALRLAFEDAGYNEIGSKVDTLVMTRSYIDSVAVLEAPFGRSTKPTRSVANLLGLNPARSIYGAEGGQSPQRYVNEFAEAIFRGECEVVALCGGESTAAMKTALRQGWSLDWHDDPTGEVEDRGFKAHFTDVEKHHQITLPTQVYAVFENAWRHKHGLSLNEHRQVMGRLLSRFSEIAAANPYSQFPVARSASFLAEESPDNYTLNVPYTKWMVAQDAVNQGAAVVLTSVGTARELGIPEDRTVYLHGYADADDTYVSQRQDLSVSVPMKAAYQHAFEMAGKSVENMSLFDIYSCFPIAVLAACDALGIDWQDERDLTITGGLPFFGGPGNSYSLHAIAELHQQLRSDSDAFGFISANGGYLTKQSVGIYSRQPATNWAPRETNQAQQQAENQPTLDVVYPFDGQARIETYSVVYKKSIPAIGYAICRDVDTDRRVLAKVERGDEQTIKSMLTAEPIGRLVNIRTTDRGAYMVFADG